MRITLREFTKGYKNEGGVVRRTNNNSADLGAGNRRVTYTKFKEKAQTDAKYQYHQEGKCAELASLTSRVILWHSLEERGEVKHMTSSLLPGLLTSQMQLSKRAKEASDTLSSVSLPGQKALKAGQGREKSCRPSRQAAWTWSAF